MQLTSWIPSPIDQVIEIMVRGVDEVSLLILTQLLSLCHDVIIFLLFHLRLRTLPLFHELLSTDLGRGIVVISLKPMVECQDWMDVVAVH